MRTIITKLSALAVFSLLFATVLSATPIYMQYEGVDGSIQTAPVDKNGSCSFKIVKPGNYKTYLLVPAVQKVREAANTSSDNHKETIEILSWSWGASNPSMSGGGGGTGREASTPSVSEIVVTKTMDNSSPQIMQGSSRGKVTVPLNSKTTYKGQEYYKVTMTDVMVSSWQTSSSGDRPMESISLNFTKISYNYMPQNEESPVIAKGSWNLKENVK